METEEGGAWPEQRIIIGAIIIWGKTKQESNQKYVQVEFTENGPERALVVGVSQKSGRNQKAIHDVDTGGKASKNYNIENTKQYWNRMVLMPGAGCSFVPPVLSVSFCLNLDVICCDCPLSLSMDLKVFLLFVSKCPIMLGLGGEVSGHDVCGWFPYIQSQPIIAKRLSGERSSE